MITNNMLDAENSSCFLASATYGYVRVTFLNSLNFSRTITGYIYIFLEQLNILLYVRTNID
jgi:hypothetical protein